MKRITPEDIWQAHRTLAGGLSFLGDALPTTLDKCVKERQETHYGLAVFISLVQHGDANGCSIPPLVTPERAEELKAIAREHAHPFLEASGRCVVEVPPKKSVTMAVNIDTREASAGLAALQAQLVEVEAQVDRVLAKIAAARAGSMGAAMTADR